MRGILKALAVTGMNGKAFGDEIGVDKYMMSKFANGHCNPTPEVFRKICDRSGLSPNEVATVEDVDYGVIPTLRVAPSKKPCVRKNPYRLQCRVSAKTDLAFRELAMREGVTINDMLLRLINQAVRAQKRGGQHE